MGLGFQDVLLMGMGFRNKLPWENGIPPTSPTPSGPCIYFRSKNQEIEKPKQNVSL